MNVLNKVMIKNLKINKTRTLVTIIGIILSLAMFTAVLTSVTTSQKYMVNSIIADTGSYYAMSAGVKAEDVEKMGSLDKLKEYTVLADIGVSADKEENSLIKGMAKDFEELVSIKLYDGKMPANENEILLPYNYVLSKKLKNIIGQNISIEVQNPEDGAATTRSYTVTGIYRETLFNYKYDTINLFLCRYEGEIKESADVFYTTKRMSEIESFVNENDFLKKNVDYNSDLLTYSGAGLNNVTNKALYSMAIVLSALIMFGSVSLIYNAFAISVSERTKLYGIFKSVGATKKQIRKSVSFEGIVLCTIGIPLGIGAGILGMFVTFKALGSQFEQLFEKAGDVPFTLYVNVPGVLIAALIGFVTVMISTRIPAKRVARIPALEAIRQTKDISINGKKLKTSRLTYKLFKFEGLLSSKNFKRNKKKYRATVLSLFLSIVLFVAASCFCEYLTNGIRATTAVKTYDIFYSFCGDDKDVMSVEELKKLFATDKDVTEIAYCERGLFGNIELTKEQVSDKLYKVFEENNEEFNGVISGTVQYVFFEDEAYRKVLEENKLDVEKYMSVDNPVATSYNYATIPGKKYYNVNLFDDTDFDLPVTIGDNEVKTTAHIGAFLDKPPIGTNIRNESGIVYLIYPYSAMEKVRPVKIGKGYPEVVLIKSDDHRKTTENIMKMLENEQLDYSRVIDVAEDVMTQQAIVTIIKVFSYGFIFLISLIAIANVFNTISTNVSLRRREFAILKSVGMTQKGFRRMMNFECILYGVKGLIYGLPGALIVDFLMWKGVGSGLEMEFIIPWRSIIISVVSVFIVVFATMIYSMSKIRKDNTVDVLKNENL